MNTFDITLANNNIDGSLIQTVEGRQIHTVLEVGKDYSNWVKAQIERARLVENTDFVKVAQKGELSTTGQTRIEYHFTLDASKNIAMMSGTDKGHKVRAYFIECEKKLLAPKPLSTSAALLQSVQLMVALEERCVVIEQAQSSITNRLESVEQTNVWKVCPTAAESIVHIRKRINIKHGLSASVVDEVMRQSVYAPKPSGTVHNNNEYAGNSHYAVYWKKDVSKVFELFMKETKQETPFRFSHPIISGNFKANFV